MVLIQLLLPTTIPDRPASENASAALAQTRAELTETFGGVTAYLRSPAKGIWTAPDGQPEQEDVVMLEIVAERFDRAWWRAYADRLAARFEQEVVHVRALPIEMLDEEGR